MAVFVAGLDADSAFDSAGDVSWFLQGAERVDAFGRCGRPLGRRAAGWPDRLLAERIRSDGINARRGISYENLRRPPDNAVARHLELPECIDCFCCASWRCSRRFDAGSFSVLLHALQRASQVQQTVDQAIAEFH